MQFLIFLPILILLKVQQELVRRIAKRTMRR